MCRTTVKKSAKRHSTHKHDDGSMEKKTPCLFPQPFEHTVKGGFGLAEMQT